MNQVIQEQIGQKDFLMANMDHYMVVADAVLRSFLQLPWARNAIANPFNALTRPKMIDLVKILVQNGIKITVDELMTFQSDIFEMLSSFGITKVEDFTEPKICSLFVAISGIDIADYGFVSCDEFTAGSAFALASNQIRREFDIDLTALGISTTDDITET